MTEYQHRLAQKERGHHAWQHIAGKGDEILNQMTQQSKMPLSAAANPWNA